MMTNALRRFAALIVDGRWFWVLLAVCIAAAGIVGLRGLTLDPDARVFFAEENPDRIALDAFEAAFAKDDVLIMALAPKDGDVFTPHSLKAIGDLTERSWLLPYVRRVNSLTNFQHTYAEGDDMVVRDLAPDPANVSDAEAAEARAIALSRIELRDLMVAADGDVTQVQVLFRLPQGSLSAIPEVMAETRALVAQFRADYPQIDVYVSGTVVVNNEFAEAGAADGKTLTPLMFLAIITILAVALGSVVSTGLVLVVIVLSAIAGLGALGWSGVPLNSATVIAPLIIMTLAAASAVHLLASVRQTMLETDDRKEWARRALEGHAVAITVACVTTAMGFLSLNFSISPPFRELGNIVALGVMAAWLLTLTLLPALITFAPIRRHERKSTGNRLMEGFAEWVIRWRKALLWGVLSLGVGLCFGIPRLSLEDDFLRYFDKSFESRRAVDFIEDRLTGLNALEYALDSGREGGVNDPAFLRDVDAFAQWLREQPEVGSVRSLTDVIKRLNMNMHADNPDYARLPDNADEAAQYLFLYELSLGYGMDLTDQINVERSALRLTVGAPRISTAGIRALELRADEWLAANAPAIRTTPTGLSHVFSLISYRDVRAMLSGTVLALIGISALMFVVLRDWRLGLISLVPNLIPAAMAFGAWGYLVGSVTLAIAVVVAMTLGIVVDDTVHFLVKYRESRQQGLSPEDAVRRTFAKVGLALTATTLGLVAGFAILAQSGFAVNGDMAKLTAITIILALIADFLLLPPLLMALDRRRD